MANKVSMSIIQRDVNGDTTSTTVSNINPALFDTTDTAKLQASYEFVDRAARTLNSLSTNTYVNAILSTDVDVNEQLAD